MDALRLAFARCARALTRRSLLGRKTGVSRTRLRHGLICEIADGPWTLVADMPAQGGGAAAAPTPGVFGRAALGTCLAAGYMLHAARLNVPIASIEVEVEARDDEGALLGVGGATPGSLEVRYEVTVESDASEVDIRRVLDEGDAHSLHLPVFANAQKSRRAVRIVRSREGVSRAGVGHPY